MNALTKLVIALIAVFGISTVVLAFAAIWSSPLLTPRLAISAFLTLILSAGCAAALQELNLRTKNRGVQ